LNDASITADRKLIGGLILQLKRKLLCHCVERKREGFEELGSRAPDIFVCARIRGWRAFFEVKVATALGEHVCFKVGGSGLPSTPVFAFS